MLELINSLIETSRGWNAFALLLISFFLYALMSNLAALPFFSARFHVLQSSRSVLPKTAFGVVIELLRFGFYIGVPFAALSLGWINLPSMGLGQVDWAEGLRWAIVVLLAAWLVLMIIWLPYLRATADVPAAPNLNDSFPRRLVELIYMQAHWAFYRAAAIGLFTQVIPDNGYWGTALGLGIVSLEAFTNPQIRERLGRMGSAEPTVWNFGQAAINALSFLVTRNLYLLALIHLALEITVPHTRTAPQPKVSRLAPTREQR